jgi:hypothetical protein
MFEIETMNIYNYANPWSSPKSYGRLWKIPHGKYKTKVIKAQSESKAKEG